MIQRIEHRGVEGLRVGRFGSRINTACIVYRIGSTLVDTGPPNQWSSVKRFVEEREVRNVVVTHHHEDHSGNLGPIRETVQPEIYSPAGGIGPLRDGFKLRPYQKVIWGRPKRVCAEPLPEEIDLGDGRTLRALATPGHSRDSTCYLEPERGWLFTGDLYISHRTRYLRIDESVGDHIESLRRIAELEIDTLFCSHRGVVGDGGQALRGKLDFLVRLCEQVRELRDQGHDAMRITRKLLGREDWMSWMTGMHFCKVNLVHSCLAALEAGIVR